VPVTGLAVKVIPPPVKLLSALQTCPNGSVYAEELPVLMRMRLKTGAAVMANVTGELVPAGVVAVTLKFPNVALAAIVKVAVIWVELTTATLLTAISGLVVETVAPEAKLVPASVTVKLEPATPLEGLIEESVGGPREMVNGTAAVVPPDVVTVTLAAPVEALEPILNVAVICVPLTTLTLLTVTPGLLTATVAPGTKFVPERVTPTAVPCVPAEGVIEVNVGDGELIVKADGLLVPAVVVTLTLVLPRAALGPIVKVAVI
jgi:hypothetical protein